MITNSPKTIDNRQRSRRITSEEKLIEYILTSLGSPIIEIEVTQEQIELIIDDTIKQFSDYAYSAQSHVGFIIETIPGVSEYILDERVEAVKGCSLGGTLGAVPSQGNNHGGISLGAFGTVGIGYVPHITMQGEVSSLEGGINGSLTNANGVAGGVAGTGKNSLGRMADAFVMLSHAESMRTLFDRAVNWSFNSGQKKLKLFEEVQGPVMIEASLEYIPNRDYDEIYSETWIKAYSTARTKKQWGINLGKFSQTLIGGAEINFDRLISEAETEIEKLEEDLMVKYTEAFGVFSG